MYGHAPCTVLYALLVYFKYYLRLHPVLLRLSKAGGDRIVPEVEHQPKRDSWSLSLVFVYIIPTCPQIRSGRVRSFLHGIRSLLFLIASTVALRDMGLKKRVFGMVPEK